MIIQTSDFRLTGSKEENAAQKQFVLAYFEWSGLLCYTGLAKWRAHETEKWLTDLLTHEPGEKRKPHRVATLVAEEGVKWFRKIPERYRLQTFTLAVFRSGQPLIYMISNFQRAGQKDLTQALDHFIISRYAPRRIKVVATGSTQFIKDEDLDEVKSSIEVSRDLHVLRRAGATVSRHCAQRSQRMIGENCVAAHMLRDGSGEVQVFGNVSEAFVPTMILNGTNTAVHVPNVLSAAGVGGTPHRLVGMTWNVTAGGHAIGAVGAYRDVADISQSGW